MNTPQQQQQQQPPPPTLPAGWSACWDNTYRTYYYLSSTTGESTWEIPKQPAIEYTPPPYEISQEISTWGRNTNLVQVHVHPTSKATHRQETPQKHSKTSTTSCGLCMVRGKTSFFDDKGLCSNSNCRRDKLGFWHCERVFQNAGENNHQNVPLSESQLCCPDCEWVRPGPWRCTQCYHLNDSTNKECAGEIVIDGSNGMENRKNKTIE